MASKYSNPNSLSAIPRILPLLDDALLTSLSDDKSVITSATSGNIIFVGTGEVLPPLVPVHNPAVTIAPVLKNRNEETRQLKDCHALMDHPDPGRNPMYLSNQAILRLKQVIARTGRGRSSIYQGILYGTFPDSIKLGGRSVGWLESEINDWIGGRISASRNADGQSVAKVIPFLAKAQAKLNHVAGSEVKHAA
jgi:prophage regulatory protein